MNLRPPRKKKRVKLKPQIPLPIPLNGTEEWPVYTAHLTDVGSCIIEPEEINAIHSMVRLNLIRRIFLLLAIAKSKYLSTGFFWQGIIVT